jgi:cobalt/nickel transport system permease protein/cobalt/nickel transport protein
MKFWVRTRTFLAVGLLAALLVAGIASYYASSHPDGLNAVAAKTGFVDRSKTSATSDGPLAGYETKGIADDRLSGGVAGVAGALLVLVVGGGLFRLLRRRTPGDEPGEA